MSAKTVVFNESLFRLLESLKAENSMSEVSPEEVDVKPMEPKLTLNPKFWINGKLNSKVRLRLLDIADEFVKTLNVSWVKPKDIVFTGSLANYNWTKYSDVDVHVIIPYKEVYKDSTFVKDFFDMKKREWSDNHEDLKIYGFPVEMYVEDEDDPASSNGVYSLETNKWVKEPSPFGKKESFNKELVRAKSADLMTKIDSLSEMVEKEDDTHKLEKLMDKSDRLIRKLHAMRKKSLENGSEMSNGNVIYKVIRASGYLDKLWDAASKAYDKANSIVA